MTTNAQNQTMQTVAPQAGDLSSRAMLIRFSATQWSGRKLDKAASRKATTDAGAVADAARVNKYLAAGHDDSLKAIQAIISTARQEVDKVTLPWGRARGNNILTNSAAMPLIQVLTSLQGDLKNAVEFFVTEDYPAIVYAARTALGDLFDPADYPPAESMRSRFTMEWDIYPIPDANDFRVAMGNDDAEVMRQQITASVQRALTEATAAAWERLSAPLNHMVDTLSAYGSGDAKKLYDSVLGNVREIAGLLPSLDVGGGDLTRIGAETLAALDGLTTDQLKASQHARETAITGARGMLAKIRQATGANAPAMAPATLPMGQTTSAASIAPPAPAMVSPVATPAVPPALIPAPVPARRPMFAPATVL